MALFLTQNLFVASGIDYVSDSSLRPSRTDGPVHNSKQPTCRLDGSLRCSIVMTDLATLFREMAQEKIWLPPSSNESFFASYDSFQKSVAKSPFSKMRSTVRSESDLWRLSRIGMILSDVLIVSGSSHNKLVVTISQKPADVLERSRQRYVTRALAAFDDTTIDKWRTDAQSFINDGRLVYLPERCMYEATVTPGSARPAYKVTKLSSNRSWTLASAVSDCKRESSTPLLSQTDLNIADSRGRVISLAVPFLDRIPLKLLYQCLRDESDTLAGFRKEVGHLSKRFRDLNATVDENKLHDTLVELQNDVLRPEIDKMNRAFKRIVSTRSVRLAGTTLGCFGLGIVGLTSGSVASVLQGVLGVAGVGQITKEFADYKNELLSMKDNPWYLAWRLSRAAGER